MPQGSDIKACLVCPCQHTHTPCDKHAMSPADVAEHKANSLLCAMVIGKQIDTRHLFRCAKIPAGIVPLCFRYCHQKQRNCVRDILKEYSTGNSVEVTSRETDHKPQRHLKLFALRICGLFTLK